MPLASMLECQSMCFHYANSRYHNFRRTALGTVVILVIVSFMQGRPAVADPAPITTVAVGNNPFTVGVNTVTNRLYVSNVNEDRKSTRLNSSHSQISYAVFCLKKKKKKQ